jgi:S-adenosylhomocysteine hydrolase
MVWGIIMNRVIRNAALAPSGIQKIEWVKRHMPILDVLEKRFAQERPFHGLRIAMSIHLEAKTARLALLFKTGGAEVFATGCNTLSTQDDVAAGLAELGVNVCAWHGATDAEYHAHLLQTLSCKPHLILDDGGEKTVYLLAEGKLVNLAAGDGHPAEIMDISFALQALSMEYLVKNQGRLPIAVHPVPDFIDTAVASLKLQTLGLSIDTLTPEQEEYIKSAND